jgi:hypothetical protein
LSSDLQVADEVYNRDHLPEMVVLRSTQDSLNPNRNSYQHRKDLLPKTL